MLHLPGTKISPNPSKEYGLRQTDNVDFFSLGTLRTIGSCSLLPPPSQSQTKQTVIYEPSSQSDTVYMYNNTKITMYILMYLKDTTTRSTNQTSQRNFKYFIDQNNALKLKLLPLRNSYKDPHSLVSQIITTGGEEGQK